MHGAGESVEETRVYASGCEQLTNVLQGVDGVLRGLSGEAVHQVGMYEDPRVGEGSRDASDLLDRHALLHELEQSIRCDFQSAGDGDAAAFGQQLAKPGIE